MGAHGIRSLDGLELDRHVVGLSTLIITHNFGEPLSENYPGGMQAISRGSS